MNKNGFLQSFVWPACMWITHAFVGLLLFMVLVSAVPRFTAVMADFDVELPPVSQLLITLSHLVIQYWYLLLPILALLDAAFLFGLSQMPSKFLWLRSLWFNAIMVATILVFFLTVIGVVLPVSTFHRQLTRSETRYIDNTLVTRDGVEKPPQDLPGLEIVRNS